MKLILLSLLINVTGCVSGSPEDIRLDTFCLNANPIRGTSQDADRISDALVDQILKHNETGRKLCGWKN